MQGTEGMGGKSIKLMPLNMGGAEIQDLTVMGEFVETYTFSRALHLMRYSGKYTQSNIDDQEKFCVVRNELLRSSKINGIWTVPQPVTGLPSAYIMGSWVEVK